MWRWVSKLLVLRCHLPEEIGIFVFRNVCLWVTLHVLSIDLHWVDLAMGRNFHLKSSGGTLNHRRAGCNILPIRANSYFCVQLNFQNINKQGKCFLGKLWKWHSKTFLQNACLATGKYFTFWGVSFLFSPHLKRGLVNITAWSSKLVNIWMAFVGFLCSLIYLIKSIWLVSFILFPVKLLQKQFSKSYSSILLFPFSS